MKLFKSIIAGLGVVSLSLSYHSCSKEMPQVAQLDTDFSTSSTVQVFSATVKAARNYVYVDGVPVSGSTLAYGGVFPGTAYSFKIKSGSHAVLIKDTLSTTTQTPLTFTQTFDAGKFYTVFTYDTITSIKQLTVENSITVPKDTTAMLRFANFVYNPTAMPNVDVYSFRKLSSPTFISTAVLNNANVGAPSFTGATPLFSNVATNTVTAFIPYISGQVDTLYVFATGTTTPLLAKNAVNSATPTRSYTSVFNGSYRGNLAARPVTTFATY